MENIAMFSAPNITVAPGDNRSNCLESPTPSRNGICPIHNLHSETILVWNFIIIYKAKCNNICKEAKIWVKLDQFTIWGGKLIFFLLSFALHHGISLKPKQKVNSYDRDPHQLKHKKNLHDLIEIIYSSVSLSISRKNFCRWRQNRWRQRNVLMLTYFTKVSYMGCSKLAIE